MRKRWSRVALLGLLLSCLILPASAARANDRDRAVLVEKMGQMLQTATAGSLLPVQLVEHNRVGSFWRRYDWVWRSPHSTGGLWVITDAKVEEVIGALEIEARTACMDGNFDIDSGTEMERIHWIHMNCRRKYFYGQRHLAFATGKDVIMFANAAYDEDAVAAVDREFVKFLRDMFRP